MRGHKAPLFGAGVGASALAAWLIPLALQDPVSVALLVIAIIAGLVGAACLLLWAIVAFTEPSEPQVLERLEKLLERHELTLEELGRKMNLDVATVERIVHSPPAVGRVRLRSTARGQVVSIAPAVEDDVAGHVKPRKAQPIGPAPTYQAETVFPPAAVVQGDRPGWRAWCEVDAEQGYGAVLQLGAESETGKQFRCRVWRPDGGWADHVSKRRSTTSIGAHYPLAFRDVPPPSEGEYRFSWFGYVDASPNELLLATETFKVNQSGQIFCRNEPR